MGSEKIKDATQHVDFNHPAAGIVKILDHDQALIEEFCPPQRSGETNTDEPTVLQPRKKVAIVGFAQSSKDRAPYNDPTWSIWGLNQLYRHIPRADRWLEIHSNWNEHVVEGTDHKQWLADAPIPIYMAERIPEIPNSVRYPIERVMAGNPDYFTSTVAYGIALAIAEGFEEIGLWGIDLTAGSEYEYQKPCAEFWIGIAHAKGIHVTIATQSALLKQTHRYGYEIEPKSLILLSETQRRYQGLLAKQQETLQLLKQIEGAIMETKMWMDIADMRSKGCTVDTQ